MNLLALALLLLVALVPTPANFDPPEDPTIPEALAEVVKDLLDSGAPESVVGPWECALINADLNDYSEAFFWMLNMAIIRTSDWNDSQTDADRRNACLATLKGEMTACGANAECTRAALGRYNRCMRGGGGGA